MIVLLPLESLEQRYTEQWSRWWPEQLKKDKIDFVTIPGQALTNRIELGSVLDAYGTTYYKMTQLATLIKGMRAGNINSEDVLLFFDLWFPGLEALQYIACLGGQRPKITGVLHAGTYDPNDFTYRSNMRPWGHQLEECWLRMVDKVFVATQYHKDLILRNHSVNPDKIAVTGLPFYPEEIAKPRQHIAKQPNLIAFPHRLDEEKQPELFDDLIVALKALGHDVIGVKTAEHFTTKAAYYDQLAQATFAVSFALQETFGYAMLESTALGCIPLVPDRLSYRELYPKKFRYETFSDLVSKIDIILKKSYINQYQDYVKKLAQEHYVKFTNSITQMIELALKL